MIDIKLLEKDYDVVKKNLSKRNFNVEILESILKISSERKALTLKVESFKAEINKLSKEVGQKKSKGEDASDLMKQVSDIKQSIEVDSKKLEDLLEEQKNSLSVIPNLVGEDVPAGKDENDNVELFKWGTPKKFEFEVKDHTALGESLGMLDFAVAAELTGSRFVVLKGQLARLERALINYMLDFHLNRGYEEVLPPFIVNSDSLYGTGQLPKFKEDLFKLEGTDWYLIPTSEVPVTNLKKKSLFDMAELPFKYAAYSPCFRSEAGSYGKDTRGLIRLHQFNKVEMVQITHPNESVVAHESMIKSASDILQELGLPHRAITLCSGDMGFSARKTIDLEVWVPSQNKYREISSVSNCGDFQARRAQIRFRGADGKPEFAHTLNGSGLAVGRTLVAILENFQNADGSIEVPPVLRPHMGGLSKISAK